MKVSKVNSISIFSCLFCLLATLAVVSTAAAATTGSCSPRLLVVSYDAFSSDYFARNITPNAKIFQSEGVFVKRLRPVFPTKTFTNHFSIATGLYPEVHGVVANDLYDSDYGELHYGASLFEYNRDIVPIWTLNELAGKTSGCMMWPGFDFPYKNITCTYNAKFDKQESLKNRIDTVMKWFTDKEKPANFVMVYIEQPDRSGHRFGINSKETNEHIKEADEITGYIQEQLKLHNLLPCTDVIQLSDHGMIEVNVSRILNFSKFLKIGTYKIYGTSPVLQIVPQDKSQTMEIFHQLVNASKFLGHFKVYMQPDLPEQWHVRIPRFGPIVLVADMDYVFQDLFDTIEHFSRTYNQTELGVYGVHGYDPEYPQMAGYLMAKGPSFPSGKIYDDYKNIDLYNLFVKILDLPNAPPTNGSYTDAVMILSEGAINLVSIIVAIVLLLIVLACITAFIIYRKNQYGCLGF